MVGRCKLNEAATRELPRCGRLPRFAPSHPCRRFVRLSGHSRARTRQKPQNRTSRRRAGGVAETANAEEASLQAASGRKQSRKRRSRTKPRCRARPATVTSARGADSSGISQRGCCRHENSPDGVRKAKRPAASRKTAGLRTEIGGILAWQATRSSFRSG